MHVVNDVFFTDCRVPAANVVGEPEQAWSQLMRGLAIERLIIAAMSTGAARRSLEDLIAYVKEREQFGRTLGRFQAVRHRIADLATEVAVLPRAGLRHRRARSTTARRTSSRPSPRWPS